MAIAKCNMPYSAAWLLPKWQAVLTACQWMEKEPKGEGRREAEGGTWRRGGSRPGRGQYWWQLLLITTSPFPASIHFSRFTQMCARYIAGSGPRTPCRAVRAYTRAREQILPQGGHHGLKLPSGIQCTAALLCRELSSIEISSISVQLDHLSVKC